MSKRVQLLLAVIVLFMVSCQKNEIENQLSLQELKSPDDYYIGLKGATIPMLTPERLESMNKKLESEGVNYRVAMAELITTGSVENIGIGHLVIAKDVGNKQLDVDFVPGDSRRVWSDESGTKISYSIDQTDDDATPKAGSLSAKEGTEAIRNAFQTWNDVKTTELELTEVDNSGLDIGVVAFGINEKNGSPFVFADIQMAGWGDIDFQEGVLGVTYTFYFTDDEGKPTDINHDKKYDAAFREIYFDPSFEWSNVGTSGIDVESIALHEIGHGLSQGHFGTVIIDKDGLPKATPRAVMNAYYIGTFRNLQKTDIAGHRSIWANWPNK